MPAKKEPSEEDRKCKVRQEGRRGFLKVKKQMVDEIGASKLEDLFEHIGFQIFGRMVQSTYIEYYGYCPLFAPLTLHEKTLKYVMRVDFKEPDPIVEMFKAEED